MRVLAMVLVVGCASGPDGSDRKGTRNGTPAGVVTSTGSTASTGEPSGTTGTPTGTLTTTDVYDCDTMPALPLGDTILDAPRGYNDLVFDLNGEMIGHNSAGDVFLRASDSQTAAVHAPESDTVYKMAMLASGDFVAATSNNGLIRVTPSGSVSTVLNTVRGYGLAVHTPTDMVYVATNYTSGVDGIIRVDPDTGDWEILESLGETPRAIAFSREHDVLYIGTTDGGRVLRLPLDANGDPTGPATLLTTVPGAWHDTVEVDACGNIYVGSVFTTSIFRIDHSLGVSEIMAWTGGFNGPYGHGMEWGSSVGGWNDRAVYVTHPYIGSRVSENDLGVPGAAWPGTVLNGATL